jgi:hypothetical protein
MENQAYLGITLGMRARNPADDAHVIGCGARTIAVSCSMIHEERVANSIAGELLCGSCFSSS